MPKLKGLHTLKDITNLTYKLLSGKDRNSSRDKNASIRHPSVRFLHRLIVHTFFPRKEPGNVNAEDLKFIHPAVQHYASLPRLPLVPEDFYDDFGLVGFFVQRLLYYKSWAWTNRDDDAQIGIGGLITPLLAYKGISLGHDANGPLFLDINYLRKVNYFSGRYDGSLVYSYLRGDKLVEMTLPNSDITSLKIQGGIRFDISEKYLLKSHGALGPMTLPSAKKRTDKASVFNEGHSSKATAHLFGPPRYHFDQCTSSLPLGPLRQAHDQISTLQRWNKAQDRTIFKLTNKCKEMRKAMKRQAEVSARFMRKVTDLMTRGAVAGCTEEDFGDIFAPMPQPLHDPNAPKTKKQLLRIKRNPPALQSSSGNKSPSLASTDEEDNSGDEASASSHAP